MKLSKNHVLIVDKGLIVSPFISKERNACDDCVFKAGSCRVGININDLYSRSMCVIVANILNAYDLDNLYNLNDMSLKLAPMSLFISRYIVNRYEKN